MKVFFTGSPRSLELYKKEHIAIYSAIEESGFKNMSDLVIKADPKTFYDRSHAEVVEHYKNTVENLKHADVVVVEASLHSMSMGYLVEKALGMGKPVVVFHLDGLTPFFFSGINDEKLQVISYNYSTIKQVVTDSLEFATTIQDVRFNFFIPPEISNYLDIVSKVKKIPRSVYIRSLIQEDMATEEMKKLVSQNS